LAGRCVTQIDQIRLGLDAQDWYPKVWSELDRIASDLCTRLAIVVQGRSASPASVNHESIVDLDTGIYVVHIGRQPERRLRVARSKDPLDREPVQNRSARSPNYRAGLRKDVVRKAIARMMKRSIPFRVSTDQSRHGKAQKTWASLDSHLLSRNADPCSAGSDQFPMGEHPSRRTVETAAHVEPLDPNRAVECFVFSGPVHEDARGEVGFLDDIEAIRRSFVSFCRTRKRIFSLAVPDIRKVEGRAADEGCLQT